MTRSRFRAWQFLHPDFDIPDGMAGLQIAPTGGAAMVEEHASIRQSIFLILTTIPGERVMRPTYGCELFRLAFSPNDDTTAGLAIHYVRQALQRWEQRIDILNIDAGRNRWDASRLDVLLEYRVRATQFRDQMELGFNLTGERD